MRRNNRAYRQKVREAVHFVKTWLDSEHEPRPTLQSIFENTADYHSITPGAVKSAYYVSLKEKDRSHGKNLLSTKEEQLVITVLRSLEYHNIIITRSLVRLDFYHSMLLIAIGR